MSTPSSLNLGKLFGYPYGDGFSITLSNPYTTGGNKYYASSWSSGGFSISPTNYDLSSVLNPEANGWSSSRTVSINNYSMTLPTVLEFANLVNSASGTNPWGSNYTNYTLAQGPYFDGYAATNASFSSMVAGIVNQGGIASNTAAIFQVGLADSLKESTTIKNAYVSPNGSTTYATLPSASHRINRLVFQDTASQPSGINFYFDDATTTMSAVVAGPPWSSAGYVEFGTSGSGTTLRTFNAVATGAGNDFLQGSDSRSEVFAPGTGANVVIGGTAAGKIDYIDYRGESQFSAQYIPTYIADPALDQGYWYSPLVPSASYFASDPELSHITALQALPGGMEWQWKSGLSIHLDDNTTSIVVRDGSQGSFVGDTRSIENGDYVDEISQIEGVLGSARNDFIVSHLSGATVLAGFDGNDLIYGGYGSDVLIGGNGEDRLYATVIGGATEKNVLEGGAGSDVMFASEGKDLFFASLSGPTEVTLPPINIQPMSTAQMQLVPTENLQALSSSQVRSLSSEQVRALSTEQLAAIDAGDLATTQVATLSASQVQALQTSFYPGITTAPLMALTMDQIFGFQLSATKANGKNGAQYLGDEIVLVTDTARSASYSMSMLGSTLVVQDKGLAYSAEIYPAGAANQNTSYTDQIRKVQVNYAITPFLIDGGISTVISAPELSVDLLQGSAYSLAMSDNNTDSITTNDTAYVTRIGLKIDRIGVKTENSAAKDMVVGAKEADIFVLAGGKGDQAIGGLGSDLYEFSVPDTQTLNVGTTFIRDMGGRSAGANNTDAIFVDGIKDPWADLVISRTSDGKSMLINYQQWDFSSSAYTQRSSGVINTVRQFDTSQPYYFIERLAYSYADRPTTTAVFNFAKNSAGSNGYAERLTAVYDANSQNNHLLIGNGAGAALKDQYDLSAVQQNGGFAVLGGFDQYDQLVLASGFRYSFSAYNKSNVAGSFTSAGIPVLAGQTLPDIGKDGLILLATSSVDEDRNGVDDYFTDINNNGKRDFGESRLDHWMVLTSSGTTSQQLGAINSNQISLINADPPLPALSTLQIASLTTREIAALSTFEIRILSTGQIASLDPAQLGAFSMSQWVAMTTQQFSVFTQSQGAAINPFTMAALESRDVRAMSTQGISGISTAAFANLTSVQVQALLTQQVGALTTQVFLTVSTQQIQTFTASQLGAIPTAGIAGLTSSAIVAIGSDISGLRTGQITAFSMAQLSALSTSQMTALSATQVSAFNTAQLAMLSSRQLVALETADIAALTTQQIAVLVTAQLSALTTEQMRAIETQDVAAIGTSRIAGLSGTQIAALGSAQIAGMTTGQIGALRALDWQEAWTYPFSSDANSYSTRITPWADGSLALIGSTSNATFNGSATPGGGGDQDIWITKLDPAGSPLWTRLLGGENSEYIQDVVSQVDGSLLVKGYTYSAVFDGQSTLGETDVFVTKINPDGSVAWTKLQGGSGSDYPGWNQSLFVSADGSVISSGRTYGNSFNTVNGTPIQMPGGGNNEDIYVSSIDNNGTVKWITLLGGTDQDYAQATAVQADAVVVFGRTYSASFDGQSRPTGSGATELFVTKLDATTGTSLWTRFLGGNDWEDPRYIVTQSDNAVVVAGITSGATFNGQTTPSGNDIFISKISASGVVVWSKLLGGSQSEDITSISSLSGDSVLVTGHTSSWDFDDPNMGGGVNGDAFITKINAQGGTVWTRLLGGGQWDSASRTVTQADGTILVVGTTQSTVFDNQSTPGFGNNSDIFVTKLSSSGQTVWTKLLGSTTWDMLSGFELSHDGSIRVTYTDNYTSTQIVLSAEGVELSSASFMGMAAMASAGMQALPTDQLALLTPSPWQPTAVSLWEKGLSQITALGTDGIVAMGTAHFSALRSAQIMALGTDQIQAIESRDFAALPTFVIPSLKNAQISALRTENIAALTTAQLNALTAGEYRYNPNTSQWGYSQNQVASLSTAQVAAIKTRDITLLGSVQLQGMTTQQIQALTTAQIAVLPVIGQSEYVGWPSNSYQWIERLNLTTSQVQAIETQDIAALTTKQLNALTSVQVSALATGQVRAIETQDLVALSTVAVAGLRTDHIAVLSPVQVAALTTTQFSALSAGGYGYWEYYGWSYRPGQLAAFTTMQMSAIETRDIAALSSAQIQAFTTQQIQALTYSQIEALPVVGQWEYMGWPSYSNQWVERLNLASSQMSAIETQDIAALTTRQFTALTSTQASALTTDQIRMIETQDLIALPTHALQRGLGTNQISALTTAQVSALTTAQFAALTAQGYGDWGYAGWTYQAGQVAAFTTEQIAAIETRDIAILDSAQIQSLTTQQIQALTSTQIPALPVLGQLEYMGPPTYSTQWNERLSLTSAQLMAIETQDMVALTTRQFNALSSAQAVMFSTDQIRVIETLDLVALTTSAFSGLGTSQIASLSTNQIVALTTTQFAAMSAGGWGYWYGSYTGFMPGQISALTTEQVAVIETADITALTSVQLGAMTTEQMVAFRSAQVVAFGTDKIPGLSSQQLSAMSTAQFVALSTTQYRMMSTAQVQGIGTSQFIGLNSTDLVALGSANVLALDGARYTSAQLISLLTTQLTGLTANQQAMITPIVLDLDGNGIQTVDVDRGVIFDIDNNGTLEKTAWVVGSDGLLARDINQDGVINDGGELFGSGTVLSDGSRAADGYIAMRALDSNLDGVLNAHDQAFEELRVFRDSNGNGRTDKGELLSLNALGIDTIDLSATAGTEINNGNLIGLMGSFTTADGQRHNMGDVWFQVNALGERVFDLAAVASAAGSSRIDMSQMHAQELRITLSDVLSAGPPDVLGAPSQLLVSGDTGDVVHLDDGAGWSPAGTTSQGSETYMVYVNQHAHLLVSDKIHTVIG